MKTKRIAKTTSLGCLLSLSPFLYAEDNRPNIIVILADDLGYSDLGCYGSEINTPNLDGLAENGLRFSTFYNTSRSCPTRSSLLTGLYQHQAGMGRMTNTHSPLPAYKGQLSRNAVTIAEVLKTAGYQTGMVGKWHQSETYNRATDHASWVNHQKYFDEDFADKTSYPTRRGFDDFYGIIWGAASYFDPFSLVEGETPVQTVPDGYYTTQAFSDKAVEYVNKYAKKDDPFFLYLAYNAPHWPLHAFDEDIEKYKDSYNGGWDAIRNARFEKIKDLKIFGDQTLTLPDRHPSTSWANNANKDWDARAMAVYAAMIDRMDQGIGQLVDALEKNDQLDNTLIIFLSDNGGCSEEAHQWGGGADARPSETRDGRKVVYPGGKKVMPGPDTTFAGIGPEWANVSNTPFRWWKSKANEGGICTPMIAHWPKGIKQAKGTITQQTGHIMDIMATCLELGEATYPTVYNNNTITPLEGKSLLPIFEQGARTGHDILCFEHFEEKALITKDNWKIVQAAGNKAWELYDLNTDRNELKNLASEYPERVSEMVKLYDEWTVRAQVVPYPGMPSPPQAISSYSDFELIRKGLKGEFYLTQDIIIPDGVEWVPIGSAGVNDANPTAFEGVLDGKGYTIKNLKVTNGGNFKGLFGRLRNASIKDLTLEVDIKGGNPTGGLSGAAYAESSIERVAVRGKVEGTEDVGGLLGRIATSDSHSGYNLISNCYVNALVKASSNKAGGLVGIGRAKAKIQQVYVAGSVSAAADKAEGNAAGIVAINESPNIQLSSAAVLTDKIEGGTPAYFFSRQNAFEAVSKVYYRSDMPALAYNSPLNKGAGADMVKDEMKVSNETAKTQSFYAQTLGWDFNTTWMMTAAEDYPVLRNKSYSSAASVQAPINAHAYSIANGVCIEPREMLSVNIYDLKAQCHYLAHNVSAALFVPLQPGVYIVRMESNEQATSTKVTVL